MRIQIKGLLPDLQQSGRQALGSAGYALFSLAFVCQHSAQCSEALIIVRQGIAGVSSSARGF